MNLTLISRSTTTGWFDWEHGELWLGSEGILRRKLGWRKTISGEGIFEDMDADGSEPAIVQDFTSQAIDQVVNLGGLWIPADAVRNARLRAGFSLGSLKLTFSTGRLKLELNDGRSVKLLWSKSGLTYDALREALSHWLGGRLVLD